MSHYPSDYRPPDGEDQGCSGLGSRLFWFGAGLCAALFGLPLLWLLSAAARFWLAEGLR